MASMLNDIIGRQRGQELVREGEEQRCAADVARRGPVLRRLLDRRRSRRRDRDQMPLR